MRSNLNNFTLNAHICSSRWFTVWESAKSGKYNVTLCKYLNSSLTHESIYNCPFLFSTSLTFCVCKIGVYVPLIKLDHFLRWDLMEPPLLRRPLVTVKCTRISLCNTLIVTHSFRTVKGVIRNCANSRTLFLALAFKVPTTKVQSNF